MNPNEHEPLHPKATDHLELIDELECHLSQLAYEWRGAMSGGDDQGAKRLVAEYHRVVAELEQLDWNGGLSPDAELPNRLMPASYLALRHHPSLT